MSNDKRCKNCNSFLGYLDKGVILCKKCNHFNIINQNGTKLVLKELFNINNYKN